MPIVTFDDSVKADLEFLGSVPPDTVREFGTAAVKFLSASARPASLRRVASRMGVEPEIVEAAVSAASRVMLEAARLKLGQRDFVGSAREAGLPTEVAEALWGAYDASRPELEDAAGRSSSALPRLQGVEWRMEVELASRTRRARADAPAPAEAAAASGDGGPSTTPAPAASGGAVPSFLLRIDTVQAASSASAAGADASGREERRSHYAACDYATLAMLKSRLEAALAELSSPHAKRVQRYLR